MLTQLLISVNNGLIYLQLGSRKFTFPIDCINFSSTAKKFTRSFDANGVTLFSGSKQLLYSYSVRLFL